MFGGNPLFGDGPVGPLVLLVQRVLLTTCFRHGGLAVEFLEPHIPSVGHGFRLRRQPDAGLLEQPEIVTTASRVREAENRVRRLIDDELGLQRVTLFLARVVPTLFF